MRKNMRFIAAMVCMMVMGLTACGGGNDDTAGGPRQLEPVPMTEGVEQGDSGTEGQSSDGQQENQEGETLEEMLAEYRADREDATSVPMGNGVTGSGSGLRNPEDYGFSIEPTATNILENFDSREMVEALNTAKQYVENTLGITIETKNTVYMCVDPRIWELYEAEDKGVAEGYEPENIYVCEYCDNGTWQYLILVRDGKGSAWKVIHHGSSYIEEE